MSLQRNDEIRVNVNARKDMKLDNQQPSPEQGKVHRLFREEVGRAKALVRSGRGGMSKLIPEYAIWKAMKARCYAPSYSHESYQALGIQVLEPWKSNFWAFYGDMGPRPSSDYTIDRIDPKQHYCADNCRWLHKSLQSANRTSCLMYDYEGETKTLKDWARHFNIKYTTLYMRIHRSGMTFAQAVKI